MNSRNRRNRARKHGQQSAGKPLESNRPRHPPPSRRGAWKVWAPLGGVVALAAILALAAHGKKGVDTSANASATSPEVAVKSSPTPATPGPRIQFAKSVYDFGKVNGDDLVNCLFLFTNAGSAVLELSDVSPACGCMKIGAWTHKIDPGKDGSISVQYDSHHYTGHFAKSVFVTCNDSNQPKPILEITGEVWRPVEIVPPYGTINLNAEIPSNSASVRIISHLDQPLLITNILNDNAALPVELRTKDPGREYQLVVTTAPPFPTTTIQGHVTLKTTATNIPEFSISTRANVLPVVMPIPYLIRVPPLPLTNAWPYTVWVRNNSTNQISISDPTVNAKDVTAEIKEDQPGKEFSVALKFPAGFDVAPGENVELSVKTSHPKVPVIKVPVVLPPRNATTHAGTQ